MKKSISPKRIFCVIAVILTFSLALLYLLNSCGVFLDRSAEYYGETLVWKGKTYVPCGAAYTESDKTVAKTKDGGFSIKEVEEDESHTFVVVRSFLDQYLYVDESYNIPNSGELTVVFWNGVDFKKAEYLSAFSDIYSSTAETFERKIVFGDIKKMRPVYFGYNGCPLGTDFKGYLGKFENIWCYTVFVDSLNMYSENGAEQPVKVVFRPIDERYIPLLEKHLK